MLEEKEETWSILQVETNKENTKIENLVESVEEDSEAKQESKGKISICWRKWKEARGTAFDQHIDYSENLGDFFLPAMTEKHS